MKLRFYKHLIDLNILFSCLCYGPPDVGVRVELIKLIYDCLFLLVK
jgi:hypothetical protein